MMLALGVGFKILESQRKSRVGQMLKTVSSASLSVEIKAPGAGELSAMPAAVSPLTTRFALVGKLDAAIRGAALTWRVEGVLCAMVGLAIAGAFLGARLNVLVFPWLSIAALAVAGGMAPVAFVNYKRSKRMTAFEAQFPDALDFLSRSVRAGHALSISMEMLCSEAGDPLGTEFRRLTNELNLGTQFDMALRNLVERVPLVDVRFFVSAVLLQRETGGNLTEILSNLATLIRSRFRLKGHVKAMSSQGRITALVLTVMPIGLAIGLMMISPDYLPSMARNPIGRYMIVGAIAGQIVGYIAMKRITNFKV